MKRIAITGGRGLIGSILTRKLGGKYAMTALDLPEFDGRDYDHALAGLAGHDVVIHLAWDKKTDNWDTGKLNPDNLLMAYQVYRAAEALKLKRVVMASSVHADRYMHLKPPQLLSPHTVPVPDSPYGAGKVFVETLGRYYARQGLEVICIRFGGIGYQNKPADEYYDRAVWLSHDDCARLISQCIEIDRIDGHYELLYAVSEKSNRIHDYSNRLGWKPQEQLDP